MHVTIHRGIERWGEETDTKASILVRQKQPENPETLEEDGCQG